MWVYHIITVLMPLRKTHLYNWEKNVALGRTKSSPPIVLDMVQQSLTSSFQTKKCKSPIATRNRKSARQKFVTIMASVADKTRELSTQKNTKQKLRRNTPSLLTLAVYVCTLLVSFSCLFLFLSLFSLLQINYNHLESGGPTHNLQNSIATKATHNLQNNSIATRATHNLQNKSIATRATHNLQNSICNQSNPQNLHNSIATKATHNLHTSTATKLNHNLHNAKKLLLHKHENHHQSQHPNINNNNNNNDNKHETNMKPNVGLQKNDDDDDDGTNNKTVKSHKKTPNN